MTKARVTIFLKSGNSFAFECRSFVLSHRDTKCVGYKFEGAEGIAPLFIDPAEIEAVLQEDA